MSTQSTPRTSKKTIIRAMALLAATAVESKDKVEIRNEAHPALIDNLVRRKVAVERALLVYTAVEALVKNAGISSYVDAEGSNSSVSMIGTDHEIKVVFKDQFSSIPLAERCKIEIALAEEFGDEDGKAIFDNLFEVVREIKVKNTSDAAIGLIDKGLQVLQLLATLSEISSEDSDGLLKVGKEVRSLMRQGAAPDFVELFDSKQVICAKKGMAAKQFDLPDSIRGLLKQTRPSIDISEKQLVKVDVAAAIDETVKLMKDTDKPIAVAK